MFLQKLTKNYFLVISATLAIDKWCYYFSNGKIDSSGFTIVQRADGDNYPPACLPVILEQNVHFASVQRSS